MSLPITVSHVCRNFGGVQAVDDVSFSVSSGDIAGLIGPNGAGKSTLFNLITGVLEPTSGMVMIGQDDVSGIGVAGCARLAVARTFQTPRCFASMTVLENVEVMYHDRRESMLGAMLWRRSRAGHREMALEVLDLVGLAQVAASTTGLLSGGELRMLEIARQLARDPKVLLLDEPTAGLDRGHQERLAGILHDANQRGCTVLLVEHNLRFLFENVRQVHVMSSGRLIASGDPKNVAADKAVIDAYLGRATDASSSA